MHAPSPLRVRGPSLLQIHMPRAAAGPQPLAPPVMEGRSSRGEGSRRSSERGERREAGKETGKEGRKAGRKGAAWEDQRRRGRSGGGEQWGGEGREAEKRNSGGRRKYGS
ncbi:hypothetical protein PAHAL_3G383600 [Panicum hallii]|uniref:Uncharacterized protein n=1 Tax=Panicum hallii TaxID=206008 RepID=A0A2T8KKN5_9POAL|nr:hypothetical protein PAHAL_3G383600 [Panicum hallii]